MPRTKALKFVPYSPNGDKSTQRPWRVAYDGGSSEQNASNTDESVQREDQDAEGDVGKYVSSLAGQLQARLQAQLSSSLKRDQLYELRNGHNLPAYLLSKVEIIEHLKRHVCDAECRDTNVFSGKRRRDEDGNGDKDDECCEWPYIMTDDSKKDIMKEYVKETSKGAMAFVECSFCGKQTIRSKCRIFLEGEIDVEILEKAGSFLRTKWHMSEIVIAKKVEDKYICCNNCSSCVRRKRFERIPLYSYANACWMGDIPEELRDLTLLEEMCIARARTTRCTIKLSYGKFSQYATHGNVCVFPQEPKNLTAVLPPPINSIYDEVAVIFVGPKDVKITEDLLKKSPLLVRRGKILKALQWLKANNRLYEDVNISTDNLSLYPQNSVPRNCPMQFVCESSSEGAGYTTYNVEANAQAMLSSQESVLQGCGVLDTDEQDKSYRLRKIDVIKDILHKKQPYVKYPASEGTPMKTSNNPIMYGLLWPTLFPYGVGLFEDGVRAERVNGMRPIDLKRHVDHVLNMRDPRFQTHITFPFVMMNIIQRRISSYKSKLVLKRSWLPNVVSAMEDIDPVILPEIKEKFVSKQPLGDSSNEKAVQTLLKYVNYVSEDISGSISEVNKMRNEIRSIMRFKGLPQLFLTVNPADTYNPIMQVFCGRDIDLDKLFHELSPGAEEFERMKSSVSNPAASARAFDKLMQSFINVLLGMGRRGNEGIFGPINSYYGVVEAQGRGSLHCHFFLWLKNGLQPLEIKDKLTKDRVWKKTFFEWLESIIKQDIPTPVRSVAAEVGEKTYKKKPLMCRPLDMTDMQFGEEYEEDLRSVLMLTGQIHTHSATCYKHLPFITRSYRNDDADCRFGLPRECVAETYVDDEGHIHIRCQNGFVNGYNDVVVSCLRCNMDCKFIGSGTAALAMTEYVTNYIAKISLDSSTIFSCLCAALNATNLMNIIDPTTNEVDMSEKARILLLKICNGMIGKRELSGQQVLSFLQNIKNRYTNHRFETFWWSTVLKFLSPSVFCSTEEESDDYLVLHSDIGRHANAEKNPVPIIVADYLYRSNELTNVCLWDFWCGYKVGRIASSEDEDAASDSSSSKSEGKVCKTFKLKTGHPKFLSCNIIKRKRKVTPVLSGFPVPRNDNEDTMEKYYIAILALFKPWNGEPNILKPDQASWRETYEDMWPSLTFDHREIIHNFQSIHSCKDAAHDFSACRRKRLKTLMTNLHNDEEAGQTATADDLQDDADWVLAMQTGEQDDDTTSENGVDSATSARNHNNVIAGIKFAEIGGFYSTSSNVYKLPKTILEGSPQDEEYAKEESKKLQSMRETVKTRNVESEINVAPTFLQNGQGQYEPMQEYFCLERPPSDEYVEKTWSSLLLHRKLCIHIIYKFTLNEEQALTFLLFADHYGLQYCVHPPLTTSPFRMIISGPGGTGKSQIFHAIRFFFALINHSNRLKITAPTGLAANNIEGTTVHSEAGLTYTPKVMLSKEKKGTSLRLNLEHRYHNVNTQIVDEMYFLGAENNARLSQYIGLATCRNNADYSYGKLNMIFAGDPAQLPPPKAKPLFDRTLVKHADTNVNALNERVKDSMNGVLIWRQITNCIVLTKIMRQKDRNFQRILSRLRFGNCTEDDYELLQQYVLENRSLEKNRSLLDIGRWIDSPENASPLITYTNVLRDFHNMRCAEAFAQHVGHELCIVYSRDIVNKKTVLTNQAAQAAWNTPVKQADDLAGRLPLIPRMPIFLTDNIASELGLSNGGKGVLIAAKYSIWQGRRYAISVDIEVENYTHGSSEHPHRLTIKPIKRKMTYRLPGRDKEYTAQRCQLPIIPAFAYTAHNSQSRSVESACIDLESCPSTAAAYVMLSRLRSLDGLSILRPFSFRKISGHSPQETREEIKRLEKLSEETKERSKQTLKWYFDTLRVPDEQEPVAMEL